MEVCLVAVYLKRAAIERNVDLITGLFYAENAWKSARQVILPSAEFHPPHWRT